MGKSIEKLTILLEPQEEGGWLVTSPDLPELITEIDRLEELPVVLQDALLAVLELYEELGKPIPERLKSSEILA